jgi:hypothetical protein
MNHGRDAECQGNLAQRPLVLGDQWARTSASSSESLGQPNDEGRTLAFAGGTDYDTHRMSPFDKLIRSFEMAVAVFQLIKT